MKVLECLAPAHLKAITDMSDIWTIHTGVPQGCVPSPLLFRHYTNDCLSSELTVKIPKLADDNTVVGLITDGDE